MKWASFDMIRTNVFLSKDMLERLRHAKLITGVPVSELIRRAIETALASDPRINVGLAEVAERRADDDANQKAHVMLRSTPRMPK